MEKRYQVFVSSTYADLKEERRKVIQTLMEMDCIPSGMEIFPALDEEQWEFIKKIIADCDYYILIIGGRYGLISSEGISYTEKEYDYAVSLGIKVLAFLHRNPGDLPMKNSELDPVARGKLELFRQRVSHGRLVKFWNKAEELPSLVGISLSKTISTFPAIGWVRANTITHNEVINEAQNIHKRKNEPEKDFGLSGSQKDSSGIYNLADLDDYITITGNFWAKPKRGNYNSRPQNIKYVWENKISWGDLFALIAPYLLEHPNDARVKEELKKSIFEKTGNVGSTVSINHQIFQTIKVQLVALGLVETSYSQTTTGSMALFWALTTKGQEQLFRFRTIKKESDVTKT